MKKTTISLLAFAGLSLISISAHSAELNPVGSVGGTGTTPVGISNNGMYIVGQSSEISGTGTAFRWNGTGTMIDLGNLGGIASVAYAVSDDGSVVVGEGNDGTGHRVFRWTSGGGMVDLGNLGGAAGGAAFDLTPDGSIIVGRAQNAGGNTEAFRWTSGGGMVGLGTLGGTTSEGRAISSDGTVIVGQSATAGGQYHAFSWTSGGGMVDLGTLGGTFSGANDVSSDGSVIVGSSYTAGGQEEAFRWESGTMTSLGTLGGTESEAYAVSGDGSVVVGSSRNAGGQTKAFRWTSGALTSLEDDLSDAGVDVTGWSLTRAAGVSSDGNTVVGRGSVGGEAFGFIAVFTAGGAALVTPEGMQQSATSTSALASGATTLGTALSSNAMITINHSSISQTVTPATRTASLSNGGAVHIADEDISYFAARGYTGLTKKLSKDWSVGGGAIVGYDKDTSLYQGGEATTTAWGGDAHVSYKPEGTNLIANVVLTGLRLDGDLTRGYLNGSASEKASGETNGYYVDLGARVGYEMAVSEDWSLTPFGEYHYSFTHYDGYSETSGTLAGRVTEQNTRSQNLQGGLSVSYAGLSENLILWAEGSVGMAREEIDTPTITVSGVGAFGGAEVLDTYGYGKATVGLRYSINENTTFNASLGGIAELGGNSTKDIDNIQTAVSISYAF